LHDSVDQNLARTPLASFFAVTFIDHRTLRRAIARRAVCGQAQDRSRNDYRKTQRRRCNFLTVDGSEVLQVDVKRTAAGTFTASETLDVGIGLGSPASLDYFERSFNGTINSITIELR
jgi:hypothetical protein